MSHANKISPTLKIASTKNCATYIRVQTTRSCGGQELIEYLTGNMDCAKRDGDEASNTAVPRETIKGRHTMRMCVSRDKNLESRVTRNWRCELTADLAPITSASRCVIKHVSYSYVRVVVFIVISYVIISYLASIICKKYGFSYLYLRKLIQNLEKIMIKN